MNLALRRVVFSSFTFWIAVAIASLCFLLPPSKLRERIKLGIDLAGGTYITLEVQTSKAVDAELLERAQDFPDALKALGKEMPKSTKVENETLTLTFDNPNAAMTAADSLKGRELQAKVENDKVVFTFSEHKAKMIKDEAVRSNIEVLRARLDKLSVAEITIAAQGEKNIIVELPDVADPQQAKNMIGKAAMLEFKLVERVGRSPEDILYEYDGALPDGMQILPGRELSGRNSGRSYYLVPIYTDITGKMLRDARPSMGGQSGIEFIVNFQFSPEGGDRFYEITSKNSGRQLAIVLDGEIICAPRIDTAIRSEGNITGNFSAEQANELALFLKSGAFVAPVTFEEQRQIGPSLGAESIRQGIISCLVGLGLLFIFSIFYYSLSGFLAFIALAYNLVLILIGLSLLKATLTLPGIAGMVLTVGMAIDASILIYERIKEELASGLTVKKAVNTGFSNAMEVILDANITTFIVGVVLYKFGTGPIQGFAVTMMLGIISTLITGLFFLRSLFNVVLDVFHVQKLRI